MPKFVEKNLFSLERSLVSFCIILIYLAYLTLNKYMGYIKFIFTLLTYKTLSL